MLFASKCMDTYNLIFIVHVVFIIFQQETHLTNPKLSTVDKYPTMHHFVYAFWDTGLLHYGIC